MRPVLWSSGTAHFWGLKTMVLTCPEAPSSHQPDPELTSIDLNQRSELGPS